LGQIAQNPRGSGVSSVAMNLERLLVEGTKDDLFRRLASPPSEEHPAERLNTQGQPVRSLEW
jgi:hypothetical protein